MEKLDLDKAESQFLDETIFLWEQEGLINQDTAAHLRTTYETKGFDWKRLAKYSFWIALLCGFIAFASLLIDDEVLNWLKKLYDTPDILISLFSGLAASCLFLVGMKRKKASPEKQFSNEAIIFVAVLFTACFIAYLGKSLDNGLAHYSLLFLLSVFVYALLASGLNSQMIWLFALVSLGSWFGTETGYQTNWGHYFLGMNYPLRFTAFGILLVTCYFIFKKKPFMKSFADLTYITGLLYFFVSIWLLSIFGNFGNIADWMKVQQIELIYWALLSTTAALAVMIFGLRYNDFIAREFGIAFLLINIYTRYFEYFWDSINKTLFFVILAISFWLIGRKAEKIWNISILRKRN
ncbi:MAG: DUF2157 domain-containing protein [Sphingobacteriaceae bacterium]